MQHRIALMVASLTLALGQQICPAGSWPTTTCAPPPAPPPPPPPPPAPAPAPGTGVRLVFTPPPVGSLGPITGTVSTPSSIAVYLTCGGVIWGAKPTGTSTTPASGAFTIANWASPGTRDDACEAMTLLALLPGSTGTPVLGAAALPANVVGAALAVATMQRTGAAPAPVPVPVPPAPIPAPAPAPAPVPVGGQPFVSFIAPPLGSNAAVTGSVHGLANPQTYTVGILVSGDGGGTWWDKVRLPFSAPLPLLAWRPSSPAPLPTSLLRRRMVSKARRRRRYAKQAAAVHGRSPPHRPRSLPPASPQTIPTACPSLSTSASRSTLTDPSASQAGRRILTTSSQR